MRGFAALADPRAGLLQVEHGPIVGLRQHPRQPGRRLGFSWRLQGAETGVAIALEPQDGGTLLTLTHSGLPPRPSGDCYWVRDLLMLSLANLASYCEGRGIGPRCDFTAFGDTEARASVEIAAAPGQVFASLIEPAQLDPAQGIETTRGCEAHPEDRLRQVRHGRSIPSAKHPGCAAAACCAENPAGAVDADGGRTAPGRGCGESWQLAKTALRDACGYDRDSRRCRARG